MDRPDPLYGPQAALKSIQRIRSAVARRNTGEFYNGVRDFAACLNQGDKSSFGLFHALLSVLEFAVAYVLCVANPDNGIVLPWSWTMLHLPKIMQSRVKFPFTPKEVRTHLSALRITNSTFCKLLHQINNMLEKGVFRFQGKGRTIHNPREMTLIIKRRCFELLTTIIINMDTWPNQSPDYKDMKALVYRTLRSNMPQGMSLDFSTKDKFRQSCIRAYAPYNNKDGLCIITLNDEDFAPLTLRQFMDEGAEFAMLSEVVALAKLAATPQPTAPGEGPQVGEYTESELQVIIKVQQRGRKMVKANHINRQYRQTPIGNYTARLVRVCRNVFGNRTAAAWPREKKIAMRAAIFTDVLTLIMFMDGVLDHLRELKDQWRLEFNNDHSIAKLEELTLIRDKIMSLDENLENLRSEWSFGGIQQIMLSTTRGKVSSSTRRATNTLKRADGEIEETLVRIGAVAESGL